MIQVKFNFITYLTFVADSLHYFDSRQQVPYIYKIKRSSDTRVDFRIKFNFTAIEVTLNYWTNVQLKFSLNNVDQLIAWVRKDNSIFQCRIFNSKCSSYYDIYRVIKTTNR